VGAPRRPVRVLSGSWTRSGYRHLVLRRILPVPMLGTQGPLPGCGAAERSPAPTAASRVTQTFSPRRLCHDGREARPAARQLFLRPRWLAPPPPPRGRRIRGSRHDTSVPKRFMAGGALRRRGRGPSQWRRCLSRRIEGAAPPTVRFRHRPSTPLFRCRRVADGVAPTMQGRVARSPDALPPGRRLGCRRREGPSSAPAVRASLLGGRPH